MANATGFRPVSPGRSRILVALVLKVPEARDWLLNREREHE